MFEEVDALPGAEGEVAVGDRDRQRDGGQRRLDLDMGEASSRFLRYKTPGNQVPANKIKTALSTVKSPSPRLGLIAFGSNEGA